MFSSRSLFVLAQFPLPRHESTVRRHRLRLLRLSAVLPLDQRTRLRRSFAWSSTVSLPPLLTPRRFAPLWPPPRVRPSCPPSRLRLQLHIHVHSYPLPQHPRLIIPVAAPKSAAFAPAPRHPSRRSSNRLPSLTPGGLCAGRLRLTSRNDDVVVRRRLLRRGISVRARRGGQSGRDLRLPSDAGRLAGRGGRGSGGRAGRLGGLGLFVRRRVDLVGEGAGVSDAEMAGKRAAHPSYRRATRYTTSTQSDRARPTGDWNHSEVPTCVRNEPMYIGSLRTLKGKPVTREVMRMPK